MQVQHAPNYTLWQPVCQAHRSIIHYYNVDIPMGTGAGLQEGN